MYFKGILYLKYQYKLALNSERMKKCMVWKVLHTQIWTVFQAFNSPTKLNEVPLIGFNRFAASNIVFKKMVCFGSIYLFTPSDQFSCSYRIKKHTMSEMLLPPCFKVTIVSWRWFQCSACSPNCKILVSSDQSNFLHMFALFPTLLMAKLQVGALTVFF